MKSMFESEYITVAEITTKDGKPFSCTIEDIERSISKIPRCLFGEHIRTSFSGRNKANWEFFIPGLNEISRENYLMYHKGYPVVCACPCGTKESMSPRLDMVLKDFVNYIKYALVELIESGFGDIIIKSSVVNTIAVCNLRVESHTQLNEYYDDIKSKVFTQVSKIHSLSWFVFPELHFDTDNPSRINVRYTLTNKNIRPDFQQTAIADFIADAGVWTKSLLTYAIPYEDIFTDLQINTGLPVAQKAVRIETILAQVNRYFENEDIEIIMEMDEDSHTVMLHV